jgi:hypothetical protein
MPFSPIAVLTLFLITLLRAKEGGWEIRVP